MYNGYGARRVRYASVTIQQIAALLGETLPAGTLPTDATLHAVVLAEPTSNPTEAEVRLIYTHEGWPVCLAGEDMPALAAETAAEESTPTAPATEPDAPTEATADTESASTAETPLDAAETAEAPVSAPEEQ